MPSAPRPTRAAWNSSGSSVGEQSTALPSARIEAEPHDLPSEAGEGHAGPVGRRRRGPGDGLVGDVTQVRHGQAPAVEGQVEVLQANAGLHRRRPRLGIDRQHPVVAAQLDEVAVRAGDVREAVSAPDHLHPPAVARGLLDDRRQVVLARRLVDGERLRGLVAGPVLPGRGARGHRAHGRSTGPRPPTRRTAQGEVPGTEHGRGTAVATQRGAATAEPRTLGRSGLVSSLA